jgi:maltooligosyltrehalose trehalohydrolase
LEQIGKALEQGFVFQGEHFKFWNRPRGTSAEDVPLPAHVICIQNHDQVGNRAQGKRLQELIGTDVAKVAAALLLAAPHTPLLFMGQEFGEERPFQFFTSYGDAQLKDAVREGRREEFKDFAWEGVPDPEDPDTYLRSKLDWLRVNEANDMLAWYTGLLAFRKRFVTPFERTCAVEMRDGILRMRVPADREFSNVLVLATFSSAKLPPPLDRDWRLALGFNSEHGSAAIYTRGPGAEL